MHTKLLVFAFLCCSATVLADEKNINISAATDLVGVNSLDSSAQNKFNVRAVEVLFYGPVDHLFDATVNVAGHGESGVFRFELHEAYLASSKLIPRSSLRAGRFFLNLGRLNRFHQHDWPFTIAPKVHRIFLNPGNSIFQTEGAADTGLEYNWLLPTDHFIDITFGITNGYCFGHCHTEGQRPAHATFYIHPTTFISFNTVEGLLLGASYLNREDSSAVKTDLVGIEATYKKREGSTVKWLSQSEVFFENQQAPLQTSQERMGGYSYLQYGFDSNWSVGLRLDGFSHLNLKFTSNNESRKDFDYGISPTLNYKPSEMATFRLSYAHEVDTTQGIADTTDRTFYLQFVYLIGAHPAHDF